MESTTAVDGIGMEWLVDWLICEAKWRPRKPNGKERHFFGVGGSAGAAALALITHNSSINLIFPLMALNSRKEDWWELLKCNRMNWIGILGNQLNIIQLRCFQYLVTN